MRGSFLRSNPGCRTVAGVRSVPAVSSRRAMPWSAGRFTDSTPVSRPSRKQKTENRPPSGSPTVTVVSWPAVSPAICRRRAYCSDQNHGTEVYA